MLIVCTAVIIVMIHMLIVCNVMHIMLLNAWMDTRLLLMLSLRYLSVSDVIGLRDIRLYYPQDYANKYVGMVSDIMQHVMMVTHIMVMAVHLFAQFSLIGIVHHLVMVHLRALYLHHLHQ